MKEMIHKGRLTSERLHLDGSLRHDLHNLTELRNSLKNWFPSSSAKYIHFFILRICLLKFKQQRTIDLLFCTIDF
jgi:hypothetical protein